MNVLDLPYNDFLGMKDADENEFLLELPASEKYLNHLKTVHAGALFSLAEASSGKYLLNEFADIKFPIIPMLRKSSVKYSKAVKGPVRSKGNLLGNKKDIIIGELEQKSRALIEVEVMLYSESNTRWVVEVLRGSEEEFEKAMGSLEFFKLGTVSGNSLTIQRANQELICLGTADMDKAWRSTFWNIMG